MKILAGLSFLAIFVYILVVPFVQAANGKADSELDGNELFHLSAYEPDDARPLIVGEIVEIEYTYHYNIDTVPARVKFSIQKNEVTINLLDMIVSRKEEVLNEKSGKVTIRDRIVVPETEALLFITYLIPDTNQSPDADLTIFKRYLVRKPE